MVGWLEFVETQAFSKAVDTPTLQVIQQDLLADPMRWPIVKGTGGVRKGRVAGRGKGKRGGFRYLYLYLEHRGRIYLLFLFSKGTQSNLSPEQVGEVKKLVEMIRTSR